ncbi:MAG: hypothetical protein ABI772_04880 [Bacteroidota bacterium]
MIKITSLINILFLLICFCNDAIAQQPFEKFPFDTIASYHLKIKDGSEFIGKFISRDSTGITVKTAALPKMNIPYASIESAEVISATSFVNGQYWFPNPNATRYFFGPSAINLKAGEGYYQNTYLFLNSFNVGLSDNVSIGGGLEVLSTFGISGDGPQPIFFITPKVGFPVAKKVHVGGGILYASVPDFDTDNPERTGLGIMYGIGTYGTEDHNVSAGAGWGFIDGEFSTRPIITISAATRLSRRSAFVTENWIVPEDVGYYAAVSYGIRFFGEKISVDLAFINSRDIVQFIPIGIPYVDFVVKF